MSAYSELNILYSGSDHLFEDQINELQLFSTVFATIFLLWEGSRLAEIITSRYRFFRRRAWHPLVASFAFSLGIVVVASLIVLLTADFLFNLPLKLDFKHAHLLLAFGFRVNLFLQCINAIVYFMNRLKNAQLRAEELRKISVEARFEALRTQVNPHFMFNSFNVLSTLVYKDADLSAKFIEQLSNVYRYLLHSQQKKVVTLQEELNFTNSYLFLLTIRFGSNLRIEQRIDIPKDKFYVAPASLQMLIENAIKHNIVSKNNPLHIQIYTHSGSITVSNNLQEKPIAEESTKIGLNNIKNRYLLLGEERVVIEKSEHEFKVSLPLLQLEEV